MASMCLIDVMRFADWPLPDKLWPDERSGQSIMVDWSSVRQHD